ncbi:hypothetical protein HRR83_003445 [Exophiala dermatitidis]|uniref:Uncharacterized protein n=1 Tax=Exophiala dermatitidis TaxID=5970 RepID=A0AAN6IV28_EXODE|nr:hypothetical protein HRR74_004394 [Exophiala dermatitidis]KAJ4520997.1 hypothetical protein HRR73_003338 [Exophiala dermatitidis]KAJ4547579.1 hypothetical protein HRR76_000212 [Exophiala dermatitidis]KAJ4563387.1 hypothetical protein HRR79_006271 [Exophiala dermatitidis]KAJ4579688.1 hypothetical protein HRR82_004824 [Exophiala dermatitidis]
MAQHRANGQDAHTNSDENQDSVDPQLLSSEMAKAFQELARGEQTASALESKLDSIERRIEQLLASVESSSSSDSAQPKGPSLDISKPK